MKLETLKTVVSHLELYFLEVKIKNNERSKIIQVSDSPPMKMCFSCNLPRQYFCRGHRFHAKYVISVKKTLFV